MDEQTAKLIIGAGFAAGIVFWLIGLHLYRKMADAPRIERLEARLAGKTPAEAVKSIIDGVLPSGGMARLTRPSEHALHISQLGVEIDVRAQQAGGQTLVTADVNDSKLARKLQIPLAILVTLVMPVVVAGVPAALWLLVAPSPTPAVRWQSIQVLQIAHILWPPFLLYMLWKKQREMVLSTVSNLLVRAEAS
jgi:hypothetical protein